MPAGATKLGGFRRPAVKLVRASEPEPESTANGGDSPTASAAKLDASLFPAPPPDYSEDMSDAKALDERLFSAQPELGKVPLVPMPPPPREQ
jgi:hypothetical protein